MAGDHGLRSPGDFLVGRGAERRNSGTTWGPTGDCTTHTYGSELRRMAMEFPLWGLPAGASVTKATLSIQHNFGTELQHSLRGYAGNGIVEVADILPFTTAVLFTPSPDGTRTTVDVTTLVTPSVLSSGWAGLQMRKDVNELYIDNWQCRSTDPSFPTLTIEHLVP